MDKNLYLGTFNWHLETHRIWTHAKDEEKARRLMVTKLAKKLGRSRVVVNSYFDGSKDNYKIELKEG